MVAIKRKVFDEAQGVDEEIIYGFVVTEWGTDPTSVSVVAKVLDGLEDVTTAVFPTNVPTVSGDTITLSPLLNLTAGVIYRIEVKFTVSEGSIFEPYGIVRAEL